MHKITPCLWFDREAEEAARFYCGTFFRSSMGRISHYGPGAPMPEGTVLMVAFELEGQPFQALNGGPQFPFTPAILLSVDCQSQDEVDRLWARLSEGGRADRCGWLQDRWGLSWQIVPRVLLHLLHDPDPRKSQAVMQAMLRMGKLDIADLQRAHALA